MQSWADIAKDVFVRSGKSADDVTPVTTEEYAAGKKISPRPVHSALKLDKIIAAGFTPAPASQRLDELLG